MDTGTARNITTRANEREKEKEDKKLYTTQKP